MSTQHTIEALAARADAEGWEVRSNVYGVVTGLQTITITREGGHEATVLVVPDYTELSTTEYLVPGGAS